MARSRSSFNASQRLGAFGAYPGTSLARSARSRVAGPSVHSRRLPSPSHLAHSSLSQHSNSWAPWRESGRARRESCSMATKDQWLTCNAKNLLLLPLEHRPWTVAILDNTVALGLKFWQSCLPGFQLSERANMGKAHNCTSRRNRKP